MKSPTPICEACWIQQHSTWEPHSMDDSGNIMMRLKDVEIPLKYNTGVVEICDICDKVTIAGIYQLMSSDIHFGFGLADVESLPEDDE